jgi:hypothetical protein
MILFIFSESHFILLHNNYPFSDITYPGTHKVIICPNNISTICTFQHQIIRVKGSVQRKLRWVENGVNRRVGASDCGAGRSFVVLFRFHLGFAIFPFPVSTAQIIDEFWINR